MNQNNNQPITRKELNDILDNKLNHWTHNEIVPVVESMFEKFGEKIDEKFEKIDEKFKETNKKIQDSQNEILKSNDKLVAILTKHEQERHSFTANIKKKIEDFQSTLDNHNPSPATLESQPA